MQACIDVVPKNPANFNVDNVRVVKILGGGAHDSKVVKGVVIKRSTEGSINDVSDAKVAVFAQGVDTASTETKARGPSPIALYIHFESILPRIHSARWIGCGSLLKVLTP